MEDVIVKFKLVENCFSNNVCFQNSLGGLVGADSVAAENKMFNSIFHVHATCLNDSALVCLCTLIPILLFFTSKVHSVYQTQNNGYYIGVKSQRPKLVTFLK